jgi:hypothetical protein
LAFTATKDKFIFTVNPSFHFLLYTYMRLTLPAIRVKANYKKYIQICWTHNTPSNYTVKGEFKIGDSTPQTIDSKWIDITSQYYMKPGFRKHYRACMGNISMLEDWNTSLPEYTTNLIHPFYNTSASYKAFPILYAGDKIPVTYQYKVKDKISDLLRMRFYGKFPGKSVGWHEIPVNSKYLDGFPSDGKMPLPELWGRYGYVAPNELARYQDCRDDDDDEDEERNEDDIIDKKNNNNHTRYREREIYIEDVASAQSTNSHTYGTRVPVKLTTKTPFTAMFWMAENEKYVKDRNCSNYSTNEEIREGWNPIRKFGLTYAGSAVFEELDSDHADKIEPFHFPSPPYEPGYNARTICYDSTTFDADIGIIGEVLDPELSVILGDTNPENRHIKSDEELNVHDNVEAEAVPFIEESVPNNSDTKGDKFRVHVRMLVKKKITITRIGPETYRISV